MPRPSARAFARLPDCRPTCVYPSRSRCRRCCRDTAAACARRCEAQYAAMTADTDPAPDPAIEIISSLVPAILRALNALEFAGRHLSPATLMALVDAVTSRDGELAPAFAASRAHAWPERLAPARGCLERAAEAAAESIAALRSAPGEEQPILSAYRALRGYAR